MVEAAPADYSGTYFVASYSWNKKADGTEGWKLLTGVNTSKNQGTEEDITVTDGVFNASSSHVAENLVTIAKVEGKDTYTIKVGDKYLYWQAGGGNKLFGSTSMPTENFEWTIEGDGGKNGFTFTLVGVDSDNDRTLYYNDSCGSESFRTYKPTTNNTPDTDETGAKTGYTALTLFKEVTE